jgi:pimeloyl-ACP methyl ester carboxylesterase
MRKWVPIYARWRWVYRNHPDWFYSGIGWLAIRFSELRIGRRIASLEKKVKAIRVPVLMIHGERDNYLDVSQARYIAGLSPEFVDLWVVPKANHNEAVTRVAEEYRSRLTGFFTTHLHVPVAEAEVRKVQTPGIVEV